MSVRVRVYLVCKITQEIHQHGRDSLYQHCQMLEGTMATDECHLQTPSHRGHNFTVAGQFVYPCVHSSVLQYSLHQISQSNTMFFFLLTFFQPSPLQFAKIVFFCSCSTFLIIGLRNNHTETCFGFLLSKSSQSIKEQPDQPFFLCNFAASVF